MRAAVKTNRVQVYQDYFKTRHPGVYREDKFGAARRVPFLTGIPVFLGLAPVKSTTEAPAKRYPWTLLSLWSQFQHQVGKPRPDSFLAYAVRGFFENGGQRCYVLLLEDTGPVSLMKGLEAIESLHTIDLVCTPDLVKDKQGLFDSQQMIVDHCDRMGDRFAILDPRQGDQPKQVPQQWDTIEGRSGAIYYPWIRVAGFEGGYDLTPPCGHVAGVYARTDRRRGVHKAPANESLEGVVALERDLNNADQDTLNPAGVNCLRSFPGRGIRVWGARTLSGQTAWRYVNVRRLFLTALRWIAWSMGDVVFEPNNPSLWARIERELTTYFTAQFRAGALKGATPQQAFYVKCNAETNPPELYEQGQVVTEIGLAPTVPFEFVVIRLIHGPRGVTISGPEGSE